MDQGEHFHDVAGHGFLAMETQTLIEDHDFLAELIAFDYANIPGCQLDEARSEASVALIRAANAYASPKGDFIPFSSRVIRNALNSLYAKQLRLLRMFPKSLDDSIQGPTSSPRNAGSSAASMPPRDPQQDVIKQIHSRETTTVVESIMNLLTPRERLVVNALRAGNSYVEVGGAGDDEAMGEHGADGLGCVVRSENDQSVVGDAIFLQRCKHLADLLVHGIDHGGVDGVGLP